MKKYLFIIICIAAFASCADDNSGSDYDKDKFVNAGIVKNDVWTYVSLATGTVVGTSPLESKEEDKKWAERLDWDIALCGSLIRTNSGTSGKGNGGILKVAGISYESISAPTSQEFATDKIQDITIEKK